MSPFATFEDFAIGTTATNTQYTVQDPDETTWDEPAPRANGLGDRVVDGFAQVVWRWTRAEECLVEFMQFYYNQTSDDVYLWTRHRDGGRPMLASAKFFDWRAKPLATKPFWEATATFIRVLEQ